MSFGFCLPSWISTRSKSDPSAGSCRPYGADRNQGDARAGISEQAAQPLVGSSYQFAPKGRPDEIGPALQLVKTCLDRMFSALQGVAPAFAGAYANHVVDRGDPDLAVTDLASRG